MDSPKNHHHCDCDHSSIPFELATQVFGNPLLFPNILKYAALNELKAARRVCKFWNRASIPFFKTKALIVFTVRKYPESSKAEFTSQTLTFKNLGLEELEIKEEDCGKVSDCFDIFFRSCKTQILIVRLNVIKNGNLLLPKIVNECVNLREIRIIGILGQLSQNIGVNKSVKKISFELFGSSCGTIFADSAEQLEQLFIYSVFPRVEEICLNSNEIIQKFLKFCSKPSKETRDILANLKIIRICDRELFTLKEGDLTDLGAFPLELKEFELNVPNLEQWMTKSISIFSDSLLTLNLMGNPYKEFYFPEMKLLKKLRVYLCNTSWSNNDNYWGFVWEKVGSTLPNLKIVQVLSKNDYEGENFVRHFLSEENKVQFPKLEFAFVSYGNRRSKRFMA